MLEAAGWKGKRGTAFLNRPKDAGFARAAVRALSARGQVQLHSLMLDKRMFAGLIVFIDAGQAWTWKTAYNEALKPYSPGVLLMIETLKTHLQDPALHLTDSCAVPDHPVMSRLFHERQSFGTVILGLTGRSENNIRKISAQLRHYDQIRKFIRTLRK